MRQDIILLLPLAIILLGSLVLMLLAPNKKVPLRTHAFLSLVFLGLALIINLIFLDSSVMLYALPDYFNKYVAIDSYSIMLSIFILLCTFCVVMMSQSYMRQNPFFHK